MSVYFIEAGDSGIVKIGKSAQVAQRIKQLQAENDLPLKLLAVGDGTTQHERRIHRRFASLRVHGEWFRLTPGLQRLIDFVLATGKLPDFFYALGDPWVPTWHRCEFFDFDLNDEPSRSGRILGRCMKCRRVRSLDRQAMLLQVLRRKYGRLPPLNAPTAEAQP